MPKEPENHKLEIVLPQETAEKLFQAISYLTSALEQKSTRWDGEEILEESLLERFLEKRLKEREIAKKIIASQKGIIDLVQEIKILVAHDVGQALEKLTSILIPNTNVDIYNDVIGLLNWYNRIIKSSNNGTIAFQVANLEINKIVKASLVIVDNLKEEYLKE